MSVVESPRAAPKEILDLNYAFTRTALLVAAVRLRLCTIIDEAGTAGPDEIARRAGTDPEATARMLRGLTALGLTAPDGDGYRLEPAAREYLVEGKSTYLGGDTLAMVDYLPAWMNLDQTLRTGASYRDLSDAATAERFFAPRVRDLFPLVAPVAERVMEQLGLPEGDLRVLDIGAGASPWGVAAAQARQGVRVTAVDLPDVVLEGWRHVEGLGLGDRFEWIEGDMETLPYPAGVYDVAVLGHVLRFLGDERARGLVGKAASALRPGGRLVVADVFFAGGPGERTAASLDLSMLVNSAEGRVRTCDEVEEWLAGHGLTAVQQITSAVPFPVLTAEKGAR